ncbi:MAG: PLP-dependent transferase [Chloroflexi bacterium]|nr:MAG: PLP-dependent transferase [Chloroflexota bacterium]
MQSNKHGMFTQAIHAGEEPDPLTGAVAPPIYQSTTFAFRNADEASAAFERYTEPALTFQGRQDPYVYTRWGNPTITALERKIAALEGGEAALATASGMAAIASAVLTAVAPGQHLISARAIYSGTYELFASKLPPLGIDVSFVDATEPANIERALRPNTRLIYIETPGNPLLDITDIAATVEIARSAGVMTMIDNTFATPINQRPVDLGIDVVVHSATKYLCGHGDAIGGAVVGPANFIHATRTGMLRDFGGIISPFNAWLILRGTATLPLRMERHNANALTLARWLEEHPAVQLVRYPGLPSHPGHEVAQRQMTGFGGMIAFEVKGGIEAGRRLMDRVSLCTLAVSLGDVRSLICHPASTTHSYIPAQARQAAGITDGFVRFSVGLEDPEDIMADLDQALTGS